MADDGEDFSPGEARSTVVSLSQVLLAPLDALFKAQVHAARSFLSFVLQIGYGDKPGAGGTLQASPAASPPSTPDTIYAMNFVQEVSGPPNGDGTRSTILQTVSIPMLALVPLRPLAIESAEVELSMEVTYIGNHRQMRSTVRKEQPGRQPPGWFLVDHPISLRGHVASSDRGAPLPADADDPNPVAPSGDDKRLIHIKVNVSNVPTPSGLEKLLTTLTQSSNVEHLDKPKT